MIEQLIKLLRQYRVTIVCQRDGVYKTICTAESDGRKLTGTGPYTEEDSIRDAVWRVFRQEEVLEALVEQYRVQGMHAGAAWMSDDFDSALALQEVKGSGR